MYVYLLILTMLLNCYIILVDTTLNAGTKSGTEVSSFNIYLVCVSFFIPVDKLDLKLYKTNNKIEKITPAIVKQILYILLLSYL